MPGPPWASQEELLFSRVALQEAEQSLLASATSHSVAWAVVLANSLSLCSLMSQGPCAFGAVGAGLGYVAEAGGCKVAGGFHVAP